MKNAPHSSASAPQRRGSRTAGAGGAAETEVSTVSLRSRCQASPHNPANADARIVRAVGGEGTAAQGNWARASRPVRPLAGVRTEKSGAAAGPHRLELL